MIFVPRLNGNSGASCPESFPVGDRMLEKVLQMMLPLTLIAMTLIAILLPWGRQV